MHGTHKEGERDYNKISLFIFHPNFIHRRSICSLSASHVVSILSARNSANGKYNRKFKSISHLEIIYATTKKSV